MKKSLLFTAALVTSMAATAQTIQWPCTLLRADKTATLSGTSTGSSIKVSDIVMGADMTIGQKDGANATVSIKDKDGSNFNYPNDDYCMIAWRPSNGNTEGSEATADLAEGAGAYLDFTCEEEDLTKDLTGISTIDFDVTKVGTDAIRINCKLLGEGDTEITSDWLIDEAAAKSFGDEYQADYDAEAKNKDNPWDADANGYNPSRNDGSKGVAGGANANGYSHVKLTVPASVKAANPYKLTLRVVIIKCANNKDVGLYNVTLSDSGSTGITTVKAVSNADAPVYNLAGQQVNKEYKGVVIQNGHKFIQK